MPDALFEAIAVSRSYRKGNDFFSALAPATCRVWPGDRIALVGPSGSGKSTLLNLMAGLDRPSSGRTTWPALGSVESLRPAKLAVVFQMPSLLPTLNVLENVELPLLLGTTGVPAGVAMAALDLLGLSQLSDKLPEELSGGQVQRVAIARAIAGGPQLLLADEPTSQLDHATATRVLDAILDHFAGKETAIVIATHDFGVAARMDRIWRMHHGVLDLSTQQEPAS
jgi:ABC-type lipoprotein export system ATPase subunit